MIPDPLTIALLSYLDSLKDRQVFAVYCGVSTGSVLDIHFTPIKPRSRVLGNTSLSQLHRENMGTFSLFVECSWRLQAGNRVLAGSGDVVDDAENVFASLRRLEGLSVTTVLVPV